MKQNMNQNINQERNQDTAQDIKQEVSPDKMPNTSHDMTLTPLASISMLSPELIAEAADEQALYGGKQSRALRGFCGLPSRKLAMAACLCLIAGLCLSGLAWQRGFLRRTSNDGSMPKEGHSHRGEEALPESVLPPGATAPDTDPSVKLPTLSDRSTARVSLPEPKSDGDQTASVSAHAELVYFTEEELFSHEKTFAIRGTVSGLTNITIDFNGDRVQRCLATIEISRVYRGDWAPGSTITMLLPCGIDIADAHGSGQLAALVEDTDVISQLQTGAEGIFFPWVYDEASYWEKNGAVLWLRELATCGLGDGMRWAFFETDRGIVYEKYSYPGAAGAANLDDIEAYVLSMLP